MVRSAVDDDHFVLLRSPEELVAAALAHTFHQDFKFFSLIALIALGAQFVLKRDEFVKAADFSFFWNIVGQVLRGVSTRSLAVFEHECTVITALAHQRKALLVILFSLSTITRKDIGAQTAVGNDAANGSYAI